MTVGAGCCESLAAWSDSSRHARCRSTAARHHALGDPRHPRNDWRNPLAIRKRDQRRMRVRYRLADAGPAHLKEMPLWSRSGGLAVDHQHLELRKRLGMTAHRSPLQPRRRGRTLTGRFLVRRARIKRRERRATVQQYHIRFLFV